MTSIPPIFKPVIASPVMKPTDNHGIYGANNSPGNCFGNMALYRGVFK